MAKQNGQGSTRSGIVRSGLRVQSAPRIEFDCRTAYDFALLASGIAGEVADLLPADRRLVETTRDRLPASLRTASNVDVSVPSEFAAELGRLILPHPEIRTARDLSNAVAAMSDRELAECVLGELLESAEFGVLTRRALDGSQAALSELDAIITGRKGTPALCKNLDDIAPAVRAVVAHWLEPFETIEARVGRMDERDATTRAADLAGNDPLEFVENVTNGIRLMGDDRIRRIVLAPSYFGRPYNSITHIGDTQLINYPIGDDALDAADRLAPPQSVVRLHRALGDETRLRILRLLVDRDRYLTELATEIDLSKPTTKHHLALLRSAGLITMTEQAGLTYYSLRKERIAEAGAELAAFLRH